jgi:hypothetical protein
MLSNRLFAFLLAGLIGPTVLAQGEVLRALSARPMPQTGQAKDNINRVFRYQFETMEIPIMDDFSIDRTRKLNATETDPGVTLEQTIYRLEVAGVSTPDMGFSLDSTFLLTFDAVDPPVTYREPLPSVMVTVRDLTVDPPTSTIEEAWPAYTIRDTVQSPSPDTTFQEFP